MHLLMLKAMAVSIVILKFGEPSVWHERTLMEIVVVSSASRSKTLFPTFVIGDAG